nr:AAA family ATPase [uncultured Caproiciproducens sp.]
MKINRIHIGHFGRLKEYSLDLENGFQIIYGNNEDGKSTIMAFIKMMFYGSEGRSGDLARNIRKKYLPWDGAKMSGFIEFEDNGIVYRIEKLFGASNATDKISLWNTATGEKEKIASGTDLGQRFFGIGAAAFEKSVFIGQAGSLAGPGADRDDEITQKLLNLVSTGDESVSQRKVETRLQAAKDELKSRSGRIGVLDRKHQQLDRLAEERAVALIEEEKKKQMELQHAELAEKKDTLEKDYQNYKSRYDLQGKLAQLQGLDKIIQKKKEIDRQTEECEARKGLLTAGDTAFNDGFVNSGEEMIARIQSLDEVLSERNRNVQALEDENLSLNKQPAPEIAPEILEKVKNQEKERIQAQQNIISIKESIRVLAEAQKKQSALMETEKLLRETTAQKQEQENTFRKVLLNLDEAQGSYLDYKADSDRKNSQLDTARQRKESANTAHQSALQHLESVRMLSAQKLEMADERLKQASSPKQVIVNENAGRELNKGILIAAILIAAMSIVLGIIVPLCFAGLAPAAVMGVLAFRKTKTRAVATTVVDEAEAAKAKSNMEDVRLAVARETEEAGRREQRTAAELEQAIAEAGQAQKSAAQAEELCQMAMEQMSALERGKNELKLKLGFINEKLTDISKEIQAKRSEFQGSGSVQEYDLQSLHEQLNAKSAYESALANNMKSQLSNLGCETIEGLQNKHMQFQNYQSKMTAKQEGLNKAKAAQEQAKESLHAAIQAFILFVSSYQSVSCYEEAAEAIHGLKTLIDEINSVRLRIKSQSDYLKEEMHGKTIEQLEREAGAVREQILSACGGILPEMLDDRQIVQLKQLSNESFEQLQKATEALIQLSSSIKNQFAGKKNVSELEEEAALLKKEILEEENDYECLDLAQTTLVEAFNEIRQSFGPLLNEKTAAVFNRITDGRYQNVIISRNFDINVQDAENSVSHEWQYLSSGTIDQAYLALRLAVAGLLSEEGPKLPLMLDDVFLQYDDDRTRQGLKFLVDYAREGSGSQIILFTCHKNILLLAEQEGLDAVTKSICGLVRS